MNDGPFVGVALDFADDLVHDGGGVPTAQEDATEHVEGRRSRARLGETKRATGRVLVGPIIRIEHVKEELFGEIVIQAPGPSGGRKSRVEMQVRAEQFGSLHDWMHAGTTVVVRGKVETRSGRNAFLDGIAPGGADGHQART